MPVVSLYSAPNEYYSDHILKCKEKFEFIYPLFESAISRILQKDNLKEYFLQMILFHDIGKLTKKWQENLGTGKKLPSHSTIGATYLWKILPGGIKEPLSFAVAIHHSDRGLLGDNIEKPDVQAITDGIVDYNGGIKWDERITTLDDDIFPSDARNLTVNDLKEMARGLRIWAKGCGLLEQHQRRIQASLAHHILKLCDISAAAERKEYLKKDDSDYYGGWLMCEDIKRYVENIKQRGI